MPLLLMIACCCTRTKHDDPWTSTGPHTRVCTLEPSPLASCNLPQVEQLRKQNAELRERVIRACPALDAAALRRVPAGGKPIRRTRTDPT
jgi:hypothetical protein